MSVRSSKVASRTGANRAQAAVKFLLYNLVGGLVMLAAVVGLFVVTADAGSGTFDLPTIADAVSCSAPA